jgi:hypothetical protein
MLAFCFFVRGGLCGMDDDSGQHSPGF